MPRLPQNIERRIAACQAEAGTTLNLNNCDLSHAQIARAVIGEVARRLPRLQKLWLDRTQVGDAGLSALAQAAAKGGLPQLQELWLISTQVGDAGLSALAEAAAKGGLPQLQALGLDDTQVGDAGLIALAAVAAKGGLP